MAYFCPDFHLCLFSNDPYRIPAPAPVPTATTAPTHPHPHQRSSAAGIHTPYHIPLTYPILSPANPRLTRDRPTRRVVTGRDDADGIQHPIDADQTRTGRRQVCAGAACRRCDCRSRLVCRPTAAQPLRAPSAVRTARSPLFNRHSQASNCPTANAFISPSCTSIYLWMDQNCEAWNL